MNDAETGGKQRDRDERGHFLPGHTIRPASGGGRPRTEDAEKLRAALSKTLDNGTLGKWSAAMKRRIERGDQWATEFVFARTLGKVPDNVEISGRLEHLLGSWASGDLSDTDQTESNE